MKKFSLNRRLIVAAVASQILLTLGLVLVGSSFSRYYIQSAFDVYLEGRARSIAAAVYYPDDGSPGLLFDGTKIPPSSHAIHKDIYLVKSDHGDFERHTAGYDPSIFGLIPQKADFWDMKVGGEPYRAIIFRNLAILDTEESEPKPLPRLTVIYAAPTMDIPQRITTLATASGVTSLGILIPTLLLAIWSIRRALAPLNGLAAAARRISIDSWNFQPTEEAKSTAELEPLIGSIETVLAGLQLAFTRQREFMGDAAHELKTSLAILKSTLQTLESNRIRPDEYLSGLALMSGDCDRLERLLNRMLQTARADQRRADGVWREFGIVDLASTCELAIARMAQMARTREIQIEFSPAEWLMVRADPADLELIWTNLLENAVQYSQPRSTVTMSMHSDNGRAVVCVEDRGCGIPAAHLPHIFKRFYRADPSRSRATGGFGLGLAIVKSIADSYGARICAESKVGQGTRIYVELALVQESGDPGAAGLGKGCHESMQSCGVG
jgi:signal transduction histidine kinase